MMKYDSVDDLLAELGTNKNPALLLITLAIERAKTEDPEFAVAIRYCAIPRRFDEEIINVLNPDAEAGSSSILRKLLSNQFVGPASDGGYVYHDAVRDALLADWRNDESNFEKYNSRLIGYYKGMVDQARDLDNDWRVVSGIIHEANKSRYLELASKRDQRLLSPIVEIMYHETLLSPERGYKYFVEQFLTYEEENPTLCLSLIPAIRRNLNSHIDGKTQGSNIDTLNLWVEYFEARITQQIHHFNTKALEEIRERMESIAEKARQSTDLKLVVWALSQLGSINLNLSSFERAYKAYVEALSITQQEKVDLYNLPVYYSSLSKIQSNKGELKDAIRFNEVGITEAQDQNNLSMEVAMRISHCSLLRGQGKWQQALRKGLALLDFVWEKQPDSRESHCRAIGAVIFCIADKPQEFDLGMEGIMRLTISSGDPRRVFDLRSDYVDSLTTAGRIKRAEQELRICEEAQPMATSPNLEKDLLYRRGSLLLAKGDIEKAIAECVRLRDHSQATVWDKAAALTNLGLYCTTAGKYDEGNEAIENAIARWTEMGIPILVAFAKTARAEILIRTGDFAGADSLLKESRPALFREFARYQSDYHATSGNLNEKRGDYKAACADFSAAYDACMRTKSLKSAVTRALDVARVASEASNWTLANEFTRKATTLSIGLEAIDGYVTGDAQAKAQKFFAEALMSLLESRSQIWMDRVGLANEKIDQSLQSSPENIILLLYKIQLSSILENWKEGITAVENAIKVTYEQPILLEYLREKLIDYTIRQGTIELTNKDFLALDVLYTRSRNLLKDTNHLSRIAQAWMDVGDMRLRDGKQRLAVAAYNKSVEVALAADIRIKTAVKVRILFIDYLSGLTRKKLSDREVRNVGNEFIAVIDSFSHATIPAGEALGSIVRNLIQSTTVFWNVEDNWNRMVRLTKPTGQSAEDLATAQRYFTRYLDDYFHLAEGPENNDRYRPEVSRIVIEIDTEFFINSAKKNWLLTVTYLPQMRRKILEDTGISLPEIQVRKISKNAGRGFYQILMDEISAARGHLKDDMLFFFGAEEQLLEAGIDASVGEPSTAINRKHGFWLPKRFAKRLTSLSKYVWTDPEKFLAEHLESILRAGLPYFVDNQCACDLLRSWTDKTLGITYADIIPGPAESIAFTKLLRSLVKENISVRHLDPIVMVFKEEPLGPTTKLLRNVRFQMREQLPGNQPEVTRIEIPTNIETEIHNSIYRDGDSEFLSLPSAQAQTLIDQLALHAGITSGDSAQNVALVVKDESLRPFVRRLIQIDFPSVIVMSASEVLNNDENE